MVRPIKSSSGQLPQTNHTTRYRHCDGEVVIHSTNGHLVLITHLPLSAIANELYLLGNGGSVIHHGRIKMGLSALNGQRKRYGFTDDNKCVLWAARPKDEVHFSYLVPNWPFHVKNWWLTQGKHPVNTFILVISNLVKQKNLVGIFYMRPTCCP